MKQQIEEYYKDHAAVVRGYLFKLCKDSDLADELTQETFFQAMKSIHRYRGDCKPSVWLCQIARHVWYQYLEKNRKNQTVPLDDSVADNRDGPLEQLVRQETKTDLYREMRKLPEEMREVLYLRLLGGLSYREIACVTDKTENWARVTFYRAKQELMKGVKKWD